MSFLKKLFGRLDPEQTVDGSQASRGEAEPVRVLPLVEGDIPPPPVAAPPPFDERWRTPPPECKPSPLWIPSITIIPGVVLADGLEWPTPPSSLFPEPQVMHFEGTTALSWPGGVSPAKAWHIEGDFSALSAAELAAHLRAGLCRPGEPSDFHFTMQDFAALAVEHHSEDPDALAWAEWICWLNIRFIEALPRAVRIGERDSDGFFRVLAFSTLERMYEDEGMLEDAAVVAEHAKRFQNVLGDPSERLERLRAED